MEIKQVIHAKKGFVNTYELEGKSVLHSDVVLWVVAKGQKVDGTPMDRIIPMDSYCLCEMGYKAPEETVNFAGTIYLNESKSEFPAGVKKAVINEIERFAFTLDCEAV